MIADDQELIRESLKIVLSTHEDIDVVGTASDGFEVLKCLEKNVVDVILMDIRMPGMDGVMATKEVKSKYPDTKIIILTTYVFVSFFSIYIYCRSIEGLFYLFKFPVFYCSGLSTEADTYFIYFSFIC